MKLDREEMRIGTCYHEAAHAVFDYLAELTIRYVYVTKKLNAMCVSATPVNPYPWQAMDLAVGAFAGEIAVHRRSGQQKPPEPFDEFVSDEDLYEQMFELEGTECDELQALKMLRIAALPISTATFRCATRWPLRELRGKLRCGGPRSSPSRSG